MRARALKGGRGECRVPDAPMVSCKNARGIRHRFTGFHPAFPARWFYGFLRALPGDRAFLPPSARNAKHCRELTPASRRQDHTTSPPAQGLPVQQCLLVHRIRTQRFVTVAKRPSLIGRERGEVVKVICPTAQGEIGAGVTRSVSMCRTDTVRI